MAMQEESQTQRPIGSEEKVPDGPLAAALLAAGLGILALGIVTSAAEAALGFKDWLTWDDTVGPLSGKTSIALIAWAASWPLFHFALFRRDGVLQVAVAVSFIMFILGMIGIFPPVFQAFEVD